jgi:regulator of chromosome condensation
MPPKRREQDEEGANGTMAKRPRLSREQPKAAAAGRRSSSMRGATRAGSAASSVRSSRGGRPVIREIPKPSTQRLNVYVFGSGTICELGLGPNVTSVKRPRLNPLLPVDEVGIVSVAVGGAHTLAIDHEGKLWSWGQNDTAALGRNTVETEAAKAEDNDLNGRESSPGRVEGIPEHLVFVAVAATDSLSAALTADGRVWAWGTFVDDGDKAFKSGIDVQRRPAMISQFRNVVQLAGGKDHLLVLDKHGDVYAWGIGQSFQLGHQVNTRLRTKTFGPLKVVGVRNIKYIAAGEYHSFALDVDNKLWSWGLNNFGQCAIPDQAGEGSCVEKPTRATFFDDKEVVMMDGGNHHSVVLTKSGDVYSFGEMNFHQTGIPAESLPASTVYEGDGTTPSYVPEPIKLTKGNDNDDDSLPLPKMKYVTCGVDHSIALSDEDGSAWTWGFGEVYQLGHGKPAGEDDPEDEHVPKRIRNTATTDVTMVYAGAGGQFSVIAGLPK